MHYPLRVLFLCTGNSARSQMAEGLLRHCGGPDFEAHSAGTAPRDLHPLAVRAMRETGVDISRQHSKHLTTLQGQSFDFIITVCDRARDNCPVFPGDSEQIHWSFPDPAAVEGDEEHRLAAFRRVRMELTERIHLFVLAQQKTLKGIQGKRNFNDRT